jgi:oligopeptide/dipeptide ABC transporter ATP-binding protein
MHPYTRGLLDCLPRIGAERAVRWRVIAGAVPDLAFRPEGACAFAPRCPDRFEPCDLSAPPLFPLAAGAARCFLYEAPLPPREPENFS